MVCIYSIYAYMIDGDQYITSYLYIYNIHIYIHINYIREAERRTQRKRERERQREREREKEPPRASNPLPTASSIKPQSGCCAVRMRQLSGGLSGLESCQATRTAGSITKRAEDRTFPRSYLSSSTNEVVNCLAPIEVLKNQTNVSSVEFLHSISTQFEFVPVH